MSKSNRPSQTLPCEIQRLSDQTVVNFSKEFSLGPSLRTDEPDYMIAKLTREVMTRKDYKSAKNEEDRAHILAREIIKQQSESLVNKLNV